MNKDNVLLMFSKAPRVGQVKTRLQPELSPDQALDLYKAMVEDQLNQLNVSGYYDLNLYFWPPEANSEMQAWLGNDLKYFPQNGGDLGERMRHAFIQGFEQKYKKVLLIGSDLPTLNLKTILITFSAVAVYDVVLGPSADGGYYLIGMKKPHHGLFRNMKWSTDSVFADTLKKCKSSGLSVALLEEKFDIDTFSDVERLYKILQKGGEFHQLSKTPEVLNKLFTSKLDVSND